jgi:hypothetical protein
VERSNTRRIQLKRKKAFKRLGRKLTLAVGIPCSWSHVPAPFAQNLMEMFGPNQLKAMRKAGIDKIVHIFDRSFPVDVCRNRIVGRAYAVDFDWLLWLDVDQIYPPDLVIELMSRKMAVVGPIYFKRRPPFPPICGDFIADTQELLPIQEYEGVIQVDLTGMGGLLVSRKVFDEIDPPFFGYQWMKKTGEMSVSEDVLFCQKARAAGFEINVDTDLVSYHITEELIGPAHWEVHRPMTNEWIIMRFLDTLAAWARAEK